MKKSLFILAAAFVSGVVTASATCWRINPSPYAGAQFKTVAEAMDDINVLPGDTLLLDPGLHSGFTLKRNNMTVIGSGYFLDKNKDWAETQATVIGSSVYLSEGSKIEGCDLNYLHMYDKSIASRCKATYIASNTSGENALVTQCYVGVIQMSKNWVVRNNIIGGVSGDNGCIFENNIVLNTISNSIHIQGNYIIGSFQNSTIRNNILINTRTGFDSNQKPYSTYIFNTNMDNNVIQNNVFSTPERYADPTIPNNYFVGATVANTFVNEGAEDAMYQLLETSAAKGAATHGGDCGAFGGATPYVISGIPQFLPHITEALIPAKPTDGKITVKLKIANQNE